MCQLFNRTVLEQYLEGKIPLSRLLKGDIPHKDIAEKEQLNRFLSNKFLISVKAEEMGVEDSYLIEKVTKLRDGLSS